jgi:hypothetical protein
MVSARRAETRWVTRAMPFIIGGCAGFVTYVVSKRVCGMALLPQHRSIPSDRLEQWISFFPISNNPALRSFSSSYTSYSFL